MGYIDVFGKAILDFSQQTSDEIISVENDVGDGYEIPLHYLFRKFNEMPELEKKALAACGNLVLDAGVGAGSHLKCLEEMGKSVYGIDLSPGAIAYLKSLHKNVEQVDFFDFKTELKFDTILMMMNGIGIVGGIKRMPQFFDKCRSLLKEGGSVICDSADVSYLFLDDDGSFWVDLNANYYGEVQFKMCYKKLKTDWFPWLFIDFETLKFHAQQSNFSCELIDQDENSQFLAELKPN